MRSICVLQLLSNKRVQSFRAVREEEVNLFIEKIKESYSLSLPVNLSELFANLTNDVICRVAFGKKYGGDEGERKFNELLGELMRLLGVFYVGDFIPSLAWVYHINGLLKWAMCGLNYQAQFIILNQIQAVLGNPIQLGL